MKSTRNKLSQLNSYTVFIGLDTRGREEVSSNNILNCVREVRMCSGCDCCPLWDENMCQFCVGGAFEAVGAVGLKLCCTPGPLAWHSNQRIY